MLVLAGQQGRVEPGVQVTLRRRPALDLTDDREVWHVDEGSTKPASGWHRQSRCDQGGEWAIVERRQLTMAGDDAIEVGGHGTRVREAQRPLPVTGARNFISGRPAMNGASVGPKDLNQSAPEWAARASCPV